MKLIVGLGNPGKEYENTRHNIGYMVIDHFTNDEDWKKFDALYKMVSVEGEKVLLLKPLTFMNLSGNSVVQAVKYYDIDLKDVLVIHDDMDLDISKYKLKINSSSGGHNGIKSIISALHSEGFSRLKIGISHNRNIDTINYVLGKFSKEDLSFFESNYKLYNEIIVSFIKNGIEKTMNRYN